MKIHYCGRIAVVASRQRALIRLFLVILGLLSYYLENEFLDASPQRGDFMYLRTRLSSALKSSRVENTIRTLRTDTDIKES